MLRVRVRLLLEDLLRPLLGVLTQLEITLCGDDTLLCILKCDPLDRGQMLVDVCDELAPLTPYSFYSLDTLLGKIGGSLLELGKDLA
jgi:hypothetical protein